MVDTWMDGVQKSNNKLDEHFDGQRPTSADNTMQQAAQQHENTTSGPFGNSQAEAEQPSTSYGPADRATLLHKFTVGPTRSRRLQGLMDVLLMAVALLPTAIMRIVRSGMGLLGITEHRWRGISMHVPLTPNDRQQLLLLANSLEAGRLGRMPEAPDRGPVAPWQQLLLDTHVILVAASSTASAFGLPYEGMPEAALQCKLASYLRTVASGSTVCTQDCFKAMRKHGRKTMTSLCSAAPSMPAPAPSTLSHSPSSALMMRKPSPKKVAKAYMAACLMQQSRVHAQTLIQLVAQLPGGQGDLVETVSLISLAPGAEYLRLLGDRYAEQVEAMTEFNRLRPSDAKKEPEVQGMAINARVHEVGVVRRQPEAWQSGSGAGSGEAAVLPGQNGAVGEGLYDGGLNKPSGTGAEDVPMPVRISGGGAAGVAGYRPSGTGGTLFAPRTSLAGPGDRASRPGDAGTQAAEGASGGGGPHAASGAYSVDKLEQLPDAYAGPDAGAEFGGEGDDGEGERLLKVRSGCVQ